MKKSKVLMIGGCDIKATSMYLDLKNICVYSAVPGFKRTLVWDTCISTILEENSRNMYIEDKFIDPAFFPPKEMWKGDYDIIVMSVLSEGFHGLYLCNRGKYIGEYLPYGLYTCDATSKNGFFKYTHDEIISSSSIPDLTENDYITFRKKYHFCGRINPQQSVDNFEKAIKALPSNVKVCIILGPTIPPKYGEKNDTMTDASSFYGLLNKKMEECFSNHSNVNIIHPDRFHKEARKRQNYYYYNYSTIAHYTRAAYKGMAKQLHHLYPKEIQFSYSKIVKRYFRRLFYNKFVRLFKYRQFHK